MNGHSEKRSSVNDIIRICVGGQNFKTTRATLMSDENCMLAKMFENDETGKKISEIDRYQYLGYLPSCYTTSY